MEKERVTMPITPELMEWLDEEDGGLSNHELFLVNQRIWERLKTQGRDAEEIEGIMRTLAPLEFLAHGREPQIWNSFFSPRRHADATNGVDEFPKLADLTAVEVSDWVDLASKLKRPHLRARFGDAAWELSERITGKRKADLYRVAIGAVTAYLEAAREQSTKEVFSAIQAAARGIQLAAQLGGRKQVAEGFSFFMDLEAAAVPEHMGHWFAPFDRLMQQRGLTPDQSAQIVTALEKRFWEAVGGGDLHRQKVAGQALAKHHHARRDYEKAKAITLGYGEATIKLCENETAGIAVHHLTGVAEDYARMGLRADADRVRVLLEARGKLATAEMREHYIEVKLDLTDVERQIAEKLEHDSPYFTLWSLAWSCTPVPADTAARYKAVSEGFSIHSLVPTSILGGDGLPVATVGTTDKDEGGVLVLEYAREMQLSSSLFSFGVEKWMEKFQTADFSGVSDLFDCPLIPEGRRDLFRQGFQAYADKDFVKAIHVLIPQVENSLRMLLVMLDLPVTKTDSDGNFEQRNMNDVLHDETVQASLDERLWTFLKVLYTDKRGMNLRNVVMHGIAEPSDFSQHNASMVLQSIVLLSMLGERGVMMERDPGAPGGASVSD
jgi:hypothetical protein